jgi:hypothetical protein
MIMVGKDAEESKPFAVLGRRSEKTGVRIPARVDTRKNSHEIRK